MLTTESIKKLLQKHIDKGCKFKDTDDGCLCQESMDKNNPLTMNSRCKWEVKEAALKEDIPDPDVILGCCIDELEKEGWQFTFKPKYKKGIGILHTGLPPLGYTQVSQVVLGQAYGTSFALTVNRTGWMMGRYPEDTKTVEGLKDKLMHLVEKVTTLTADHDIPESIELRIGEITAKDKEEEKEDAHVV